MDDKLQKIKGYTDRVPKDEVKWMIQEIETLRVLADSQASQIDVLERSERKARLAVEKLSGRSEPERCPCNSPEDHAGWCPAHPDADKIV